MLPFSLTFAHVARGIWRSWHNPYFRATVLLAFIILLSGTLFYRSVEGWSWVDAIYFSVMTAATIGFGDLAPTTTASKVFTIFYAIGSVGVFVALATQIANALIYPPENKEIDMGGDETEG